MRKVAVALAATALVALALVAALLRGSGPGAASASSHREAPLISEDRRRTTQTSNIGPRSTPG